MSKTSLNILITCYFQVSWIYIIVLTAVFFLWFPLQDSIDNADDETETNGPIDNASPQSQSQSVIRPISTPTIPPDQSVQQLKKNTRKRKGPENDLLAIACPTLKNSSKSDRGDILGQHVVGTIRETAEQPQIFAEKMISDVLFEDRLSNLSRARHFNPTDLQNGTSATYSKHTPTPNSVAYATYNIWNPSNSNRNGSSAGYYSLILLLFWSPFHLPAFVCFFSK